MKRIAFATVALAVAVLAFAPAAFAQKTGQTTIGVTVAAEATISVPSSTTLTTSTSDFSNPYIGSTLVTYKVRTTQSGGTGSIAFTAAEFSPGGGPKIAAASGDQMSFTSTVSGVGTGVSSAALVSSVSNPYQIVGFGADAKSAKAGDSVTVNWSLPNDPQYSTGSYNSIVTFTISAT